MESSIGRTVNPTNMEPPRGCISDAATIISNLNSTIRTRIVETQEYCLLLRTKYAGLKERIKKLSFEKSRRQKIRDQYIARNKTNVTIQESLFQTKNQFDTIKCALKAELLMAAQERLLKKIKYKKIVSNFQKQWDESESQYDRFPIVMEIRNIETKNDELKKESLNTQINFEKSLQEYETAMEARSESLKQKIISFCEEVAKYRKYVFIEAERKEKEFTLQQLQAELQSLIGVEEAGQDSMFGSFCYNQSIKTSGPCSIDITVFDKISMPAENLEPAEEVFYSFPKLLDKSASDLESILQSDMLSEYSSDGFLSQASVSQFGTQQEGSPSQYEMQQADESLEIGDDISPEENQQLSEKTPESSQYWCQQEKGNMEIDPDDRNITENDSNVGTDQRNMEGYPKRSAPAHEDEPAAKIANVEDGQDIYFEDSMDFNDFAEANITQDSIEPNETQDNDMHSSGDRSFVFSPIPQGEEAMDSRSQPIPAAGKEIEQSSSDLGSSPPIFLDPIVSHQQNADGNNSAGAFTFSFNSNNNNNQDNSGLSIFKLF